MSDNKSLQLALLISMLLHFTVFISAPYTRIFPTKEPIKPIKVAYFKAEEQPKNPKEEILTKEVIPLTLLMSLTMVFLTIFAFAFFFYYGSLEKARTASFIIMSTTQLFNALNMRDLKKSLFSIGFYSNKNLIKFLAISFVLILLVIYIPFTQSLFSFTYITPSELLILLFLSSSILWLGEGYKKIKNRKHK